MNKLTIIGNLTKDPELRTTTSGVSVCTFMVAVNRRMSAQQRQEGQQPEADYFRVTVWRERGELCAKFLEKGRKVCVIGPVSVRTYTGNDGTTRASLEVQGDEVEFCSARVSDAPVPEEPKPAGGFQQTAMPIAGGFTAVETDELPFE